MKKVCTYPGSGFLQKIAGYVSVYLLLFLAGIFFSGAGVCSKHHLHDEFAKSQHRSHGLQYQTGHSGTLPVSALSPALVNSFEEDESDEESDSILFAFSENPAGLDFGILSRTESVSQIANPASESGNRVPLVILHHSWKLHLI